MLPRPLYALVLLVGIVHAQMAGAQTIPAATDRFVADISLETTQELYDILERANRLLLAGGDLPTDDARVTFVLHGPVLKSLLRRNYLDNKAMVDLAASLSALEFIEVKACRAWMGSHGVDESALQPFVEPVDYGPGLVRTLVSEQAHIRF